MDEASDLNPSWPGGWRYTFGAVLSWTTFLLAVVLLVMGRNQGWPAPLLWALALVPAATVAAQFVAAYRLIAAQDEFIRALTTKRVVVAAGLAVTIATAWSVGELDGLPHLPAWLIYPLFWGLFGVLTPVIRGSRP
ncbi:MAG: hypothetical protein KGJ53_10355 [Alphaproteobacteria bacterium]|nr:hypothetical protein [Alphaproteobacteria bacterium]